MSQRYNDNAHSRSPFDDPFFRDPFAMMNQMMGNMDRMMGNMFQDPFFSNLHGPPQVNQRGRLPGISAPMIEEVLDDQPPSDTLSRPIIEEPDDSPPRRRRNREEAMTSPGQHGGYNNILPTSVQAGGNTGVSYGFYSSSVMSNQNGVTYQKSTTARMGPGGVKEMQSAERDGRTGKESITVARGLGEKARTMIRTRDVSGRETAQDLLHGIQQEEAHRFDQEWMTSAQQSLYPALGGRQANRPSQPQRQYALPSSTHQLPNLDPTYRNERPQRLTDGYATGDMSNNWTVAGNAAPTATSRRYDDSRSVRYT
ncbi:hypothetical protein CEUSTIGMA_g508.t1 [Chlamydomonas eustigma]|uniref:Myeloid leukemia factor n=1 Tax=Chlamydomonas eustigma TaxID=1157962 RepID=A0A250WQD3_9CHLO|nr:hypothetical protein CEUSTIGMA_g508.t1 [Chlamydomonas eustigma]|eukprot:GAX73055.1 hypothetical protein CEUSTIGMA_g508.t1 [Chlamydomonas eustigma]